MSEISLRTVLPRDVVLKDPLLLASGCCGYGEEYSELFDAAGIGGVITKAVSPEPRAGNPAPRLRETPSGLLNCIGLQNPGVNEFVAKVLPRLTKNGVTVVVNAVGHAPVEFSEVVRIAEEAINGGVESATPTVSADGVIQGVCGYEIDLSCPNVESGTLFATDFDLLSETVSLCRKETDRLIIAKLSPNVTDIVPYAKAASDSGADSVTIANTFNGVSINIRTKKSNLSRPSAGLSGPAIRPATLYHVWRCHQALPDLPIIGSGGIVDTESALEFLIAGATALQLGTGLFLNPVLPTEIQSGLRQYLAEQNESDLKSLIGTYLG